MNSRDNIDRRIDKLLQGAIDPHVHSGPSIAARALDHVELLRQASAAGFAAVVTKDHDYSSVMTTALIRKNFPELKTKIYASIVLNNVIGGFNPYAVEHTAAMGGKIVWLPTLAAENHLRWQAQAKWTHPASTDKIRPAVGIPVLDANKKVRDDVKEVLDVVARNDMVLASGHLHVSETWIVFEEAKRRGVKRLVFTHPEDIVDASMNDVKGIAAMGAFVEHSLCMFLEGSKFKIADWRGLAPAHRGGRRRSDHFLLGPRPGRHHEPARRFPPGHQAVHRSRLRRRTDSQDGVVEYRSRAWN